MEPALAILLAYALGCVSFATLVGRLKGVDVRKLGSGNPGATNVGRSLGPAWGRLVLLLDVAKGALPVLFLEGPAVTGDPSGSVVILAAAVAGHVFPVSMGFRGGKGVATLIGGYLALDWKLALIAIAAHFVFRRLTRFVSVASVALAWAFPAAQLAVVAAGLVDDATLQARSADSTDWLWGWFTGGTWVLALLALLVTLRHRGNLGRIRAGTEERYDGPSNAP